MMQRGKIVYVPPERCYTGVNIEETPHGFKLYRDGDDRPFAIIPKSKMVSIDFEKERGRE